MRIAIVPGTFDPVHLGHVDVVEQASQTFDRVYWAILNNPGKKPRFDWEKRLRMLQMVAYGFSNVEPIIRQGLLVDVARDLKAGFIVRSLRLGLDYEYEFPMTLINRDLAPELITLYFPAKQEHLHISSSMIRQLLDFGQDVSRYVPKNIRW